MISKPIWQQTDEELVEASKHFRQWRFVLLLKLREFQKMQGFRHYGCGNIVDYAEQRLGLKRWVSR